MNENLTKFEIGALYAATHTSIMWIFIYLGECEPESGGNNSRFLVVYHKIGSRIKALPRTDNYADFDWWQRNYQLKRLL